MARQNSTSSGKRTDKSWGLSVPVYYIHYLIFCGRGVGGGVWAEEQVNQRSVCPCIPYSIPYHIYSTTDIKHEDTGVCQGFKSKPMIGGVSMATPRKWLFLEWRRYSLEGICSNIVTSSYLWNILNIVKLKHSEALLLSSGGIFEYLIFFKQTVQTYIRLDCVSQGMSLE